MTRCGGTAQFLRWPPVDDTPARGVVGRFPALSLLRTGLARLPAGTRKVLFFVPYYVARQGDAGGATRESWDQCKRAAAAIAVAAGAELLDFMIPSAITRDKQNYWDPIHYRVPIADRIMDGLIAGGSPDAVVLVPPPAGVTSPAG